MPEYKLFAQRVGLDGITSSKSKSPLIPVLTKILGAEGMG